MVGAADDAFLLHAFDDAGGAVVADLQVALDEAHAALALARHERNRLVVELVALALLAALARQAEAALFALGIVGDAFDVGRRALRPEMTHDILDLGVADEGAVHARDLAAAGHVEHVALAQQLFAALLAENGATVDLGRDLEGDTGREVRLDGARDDVDRRSLRRHHDVDAGGARHLGQTLDRRFDLLARDQHQVGHLVDDDHDEGQRVEVDLLVLEGRPAGLGIDAGLHLAHQGRTLARGLGQLLVVARDVAYALGAHRAITVL